MSRDAGAFEEAGKRAGVRASDEDRDRSADRVRAAAAEGRIDLAELDQRLTDIYGATTRGELDLASRDLPEPARSDALVVSHAPTSRSAIGVFGGFSRRGEWVAPPEFTAVSVFGGGRIDLTEARFTAQETRIRAFTLWGATKIVVPDDVEVEVRGIGLFGVFGRRANGRGRLGAPRIVISGLALWGAVVTRSRPAEGARRG